MGVSPQARAFYDDFTGRLLADMVYGNPRADAAVAYALAMAPRGARRILDIGCGVGWSSHLLRSRLPGAEVLGVDLSPHNLAVAARLFGRPGLSFIAADVTAWPAPEQPYDAIVLLDVYEHIPRGQRAGLHAFLRRALAPGGRLIVTCPTPAHQRYLREHEPGGLQPVDEDVTRADFEQLARDLGGALDDFRERTIWRPGDYHHATVALPDGAPLPRPAVASTPPRDHTLQALVGERLGVRVARPGWLLPQSGPRLCVAQPNPGSHSESFIRAHIERLPATVRVIYGGWHPRWRDDGRPLAPPPLGAARVNLDRLPAPARGPVRQLTDAALTAFLTAGRFDALLAEYGPTGVEVAAAARRAGVPLIVHFHGADAFHRPTLGEYGARYRRLFEQAAAIVAVSRAMERQLLALGAPSERLHYVPCGVDANLFAPGDPAAAPAHFVAVGRFVEKKGPHLTLLAFARLHAARPDASLTMVGDGPLLALCRQLARGLGLGEAVRFLGPRPHAEVAALMGAARAFVQHSLTASDGDSEGTPVSVIEAGAAGLPVIATRHGGIVDVVVEGETGLLADEGDVAAMAAHMLALAADPALAGRLGRGAAERAAACYSQEKLLGRLWAVIDAARRRGGA
jgi:glycosyltransferase involved in cell wall biosynthesis